jgi:hypothetical protein
LIRRGPPRRGEGHLSRRPRRSGSPTGVRRARHSRSSWADDDGTTFEPTSNVVDLLPRAPGRGAGRIDGGGHFTFSNYCDVDRDLLGFLGGFDEACLPRHLPWRHAHEITNYLGLAFFDATLRGDPAALDRLQDAAGGTIDDLLLTLK